MDRVGGGKRTPPPRADGAEQTQGSASSQGQMGFSGFQSSTEGPNTNASSRPRPTEPISPQQAKAVYQELKAIYQDAKKQNNLEKRTELIKKFEKITDEKVYPKNFMQAGDEVSKIRYKITKLVMNIVDLHVASDPQLQQAQLIDFDDDITILPLGEGISPAEALQVLTDLTAIFNKTAAAKTSLQYTDGLKAFEQFANAHVYTRDFSGSEESLEIRDKISTLIGEIFKLDPPEEKLRAGGRKDTQEVSRFIASLSHEEITKLSPMEIIGLTEEQFLSLMTKIETDFQSAIDAASHNQSSAERNSGKEHAKSLYTHAYYFIVDRSNLPSPLAPNLLGEMIPNMEKALIVRNLFYFRLQDNLLPDYSAEELALLTENQMQNLSNYLFTLVAENITKIDENPNSKDIAQSIYETAMLYLELKYTNNLPSSLSAMVKDIDKYIKDNRLDFKLQ